MARQPVWGGAGWGVLVAALVLAATIAAGAPAVGRQETPSTPPNGGTPVLVDPDEPVTAAAAYAIAFLNPYPEDTFWQVVQAAVEERADEVGVTVDAFPLSAPSAPEQVAQFEAAVAQLYDGIIVGVVDPIGSVPGIVAANEAAIPVVAIAVPPAAGEIVGVVKTDDVAAARAAGAALAAAIEGEGRVLNLQGDMADPIAQDRDRGLREGLNAYPAIDLESRSAFWTEAQAHEITAEVIPPPPPAATPAAEGTPVAGATPVATPLTPDPALVRRAVFASNEAMTRGAAGGVAAIGRDDVVIVGFGTILAGVEAVAAGEVTAVVAPFPARTGTVALDLLVRHLNGETVPPQVDAGFVVVTEQNVDRLRREAGA